MGLVLVEVVSTGVSHLCDKSNVSVKTIIIILGGGGGGGD